MRFVIDHDMHIHSGLSLCSGDPTQNPASILAYGKRNGLKTLVLTDHYWDEDVKKEPFEFYDVHNTAHIAPALPLPQAEGMRFLFGVETDMDKYGTIGVAKEHFDRFAFVIVPHTHLHMDGFTIDAIDDNVPARARLWVSRFEMLLKADIPFHKVGLAHMTCSLMAPRNKRDHIDALNMISDTAMTDLFKEAAKVGMGIELNFPHQEYVDQGEFAVESHLRPYRIAKDAGCKFYFGSDAHHEKGLVEAPANFNAIVDALDLQEEDKFILK